MEKSEVRRITVLPDAGPDVMVRSAVARLNHVGVRNDGDPSREAVKSAREDVVSLITSSRISDPSEIRATEAYADDIAERLHDPEYPGEDL